jgi:tyrosinase
MAILPLTMVAGIHGLPNAAWDDVYDKWDRRAGGYCAHGVLTFPTWHRPYLALFEVHEVLTADCDTYG